MKVELVCPAAEDSAFLRSLSVALLAGMTPPEVELSLRDDILSRLDPASDLDLSADLAAITVSTKTALRAYELAAAYRAAGVPVVLGGIHPSALPDEALQHADAVVVGEAEGQWQQVLRDARARDLQRVYRRSGLPGYETATRPRWSLFRSRRYVPVYTVQATRGCPFDCEFCSVTPLFGRDLRQREVADVVAEIEALDRRWVMFADDNVLGQPRRSRELLRALQPLGLTWIGQASLHGLQDPENLKLLARSGCKALFIGFESVNRQSLEGCGKRQNHPEKYVELVKRLHDHGIAVWASFVLGLDGDGPDVFDRTLELAIQTRVLMASFAIQTPYPGTRLYQRLEQEGRLLRPGWWLEQRADDFPLYRPRQLTPEQLHAGWQQTWRQFYSGRSMARRFGANASASLFAALAYWPMNLMQRRLTLRKIIGGDRFFARDRG